MPLHDLVVLDAHECCAASTQMAVGGHILLSLSAWFRAWRVEQGHKRARAAAMAAGVGSGTAVRELAHERHLGAVLGARLAQHRHHAARGAARHAEHRKWACGTRWAPGDDATRFTPAPEVDRVVPAGGTAADCPNDAPAPPGVPPGPDGGGAGDPVRGLRRRRSCDEFGGNRHQIWTQPQAR